MIRKRPSCRHRMQRFDPLHVPGFGTSTTQIVKTCERCGRVRIEPAHLGVIRWAERVAEKERDADAERIRRGEPIDEATLPQKGGR